MKILTRWKIADLLRSMYGKPLYYKTKVLWMSAWRYHPEVMASCVLGAIGIIVFVYKGYKLNFEEKKLKYLLEPIVFRSNDPRVADIVKTCRWD